MKSKRILSVLLVLIFTFTFFSLIAFADDGSDNQITPTGSSGYSVVSGSSVGLTGDFLTGVASGSTVAALKANIANSVTAYSASGAMLSEDALVGTGCYIVLYKNSVEVDRAVVVVYGDPNGDAHVDSADIMAILRHILGTKTVTGAYFLAGNANMDTDKNGYPVVDSADIMKILRTVLTA